MANVYWGIVTPVWCYGVLTYSRGLGTVKALTWFLQGFMIWGNIGQNCYAGKRLGIFPVVYTHVMINGRLKNPTLAKCIHWVITGV